MVVPRTKIHILTQFKTQAFTVFTQSKILEGESRTVCSHIPWENLQKYELCFKFPNYYSLRVPYSIFYIYFMKRLFLQLSS